MQRGEHCVIGKWSNMHHVAFCVVVALCGVAYAARVPTLDGEKQKHTVKLRDDAPVPIWHRLFNIEFNETSIILFKRTTTGKWWYDAANGNEVIYRQDGRGDRYCGGIHAFQVTPCVHLVTQGHRYLIFPELDECCKCCDADKGCGILSPTWLDGAAYQGTEEKFGHQVYKFMKQGLQPNYYYATADEQQLPVELDQWPNSYQTLHVDTFNTEAIDPELLKVPDNCHSRCPISSICTVL